MGKFRHIGDDIIHAIAIEGMSLRQHRRPSGFRAQFPAPHSSVRSEEGLLLGHAARGEGDARAGEALREGRSKALDRGRGALQTGAPAL